MPSTKRKTMVGVVLSDKMQKTITVREERLVKHRKYGKFVRKFTKYKAHDAEEQAKTGDKVEITQTRPLSKDKCWRLVRVLQKA